MRALKNTILLTAVKMLSFSCTESFLKEDPVSVLNPASFCTNEAGLTQGVNAIYASLRTIYGEDEGAFFLALLGTDEFVTGKNVAGAPVAKYDANFNSTLTATGFVWRSLYKTINVANTVLNNEDRVTMDPVTKNQLMAEARFLRAHSYFYLVQYYGDISLLTEPTIGLQTAFQRNPKRKFMT